MDGFLGAVATKNGVVVAEKVEVDLGETVVMTDEIFDPTHPYELQGPCGWRANVYFIGQVFVRQTRPVHFRLSHD